jgi:Glyoxalase-like domain
MLTLAFDALDPAGLARFWASLLDRESFDDAGGVLVPGDDTQPSFRFVPSSVDKTRPNRVHFHLTSASLADQEGTVAKALGLGASHLDVGQLPEEEHVVLADPEGNEFCAFVRDPE